jgi:antitoxin component YwqK of YwqJK toxin-antitoxin module
VYGNGDRYDGWYENGKKHGCVFITREDGKRYQVNYHSGKKHGIERKISKDGKITEAEFVMDVQ